MFILFPIHLSGTSDAPPMPGGCPVKTSAVKKVWRKKSPCFHTNVGNHPKSRFRYTKESSMLQNSENAHILPAFTHMSLPFVRF